MGRKSREKKSLRDATVPELEMRLAWTKEAARVLMERAKKGDREAEEALLRKLRQHSKMVTQYRCELTPEVLRELHRVQLVTVDHPKRGLEQVQDLLVADLLPCEMAQALGISAQAYRMLKDYPAAGEALRRAWDNAGHCEIATLDLHRREVLLAYFTGRKDDAFRHANAAIDGYRGLGGPGHDLDGEGLAKSYLFRGQLWGHEKNFGRAAADQSLALSLIPPHKVVYGYAVFDLAATLAHLGREERLQAFQYVLVARNSFRRRSASVQRARLDWLEGLLRWDLDYPPRPRAKFLLERAQADFIDASMPYETAAVTADLLRLTFPDRYKILLFLNKLEPRLGPLLAGLRDVTRRLQEIRDAAGVAGLRGERAVGRAICAMRTACEASPGVLPCLLS